MMSSRTMWIVPSASRLKSTLRALPNMMLVDCPMNTSPCAPTYSGSLDVEKAWVMVVVVSIFVELSPSLSILAPISRSSLASSTVMSPTPGVPAMISVWSPKRCLNETDAFSVKVVPLTCDEVVMLPVLHSACEFVPGGSRRIISNLSGPAVMKLLPVARVPRIIPFMPLPLH